MKYSRERLEAHCTMPKLEDCKLITGAEYLALIDPEYIGQTGLNSEEKYYIIWWCDGILYKTYNKL